MPKQRLTTFHYLRFATLTIVAACLLQLAGCTESTPWPPTPIRTEIIESPPSNSTVTFEFTAGAQPLLIEVLGADANIHSRVADVTGTVLSEIELAFLRSTPVHHVVEAEPNRALRLEIQSKQTTNQAVLTVNWYPLAGESGNEQKLTEAWRQLTRGLQFVHGENPADWQPNLLALQRAVKSFARLGLTEQQLWARYFNAYFNYYPLYRYSESLAGVEKVVEEARRGELRRLEMLGHQLAGQILVEREAGIDEAQARRDYQAAQDHFAVALRLAKAAGNGFETIWSINNMGIASKYQDKPRKALEEYGQALDLAIDLGDTYLVNLIGGNTAVAQESLGEIRQAIDTLERIERELSVDEEPAELEHIWSLQGGFFLKLYDFPSALDRISKALTLAEQLDIAESLGRNQLLLGQIYRELGQVEKSQMNVELAIPNLEASRNGRGLKRAYALAADLHRQQGNFADMQNARDQQEEFLANDADRALWRWSSALDALARGNSESALPLFEKSADEFASTSLIHIGALATLHVCVLKHAAGDPQGCSSVSMETTTRTLRTHQASTFQLEGRYLWARLLAMEGETDAAHAEMDQLIGDIAYFRQALPGVLGAWYWDARTTLFDFYLELTIATSQDDEDRAFASLEALSRLRNLGLRIGLRAADSQTTPPSIARSNQLRELIARRERADSSVELAQAQREIDLVLLQDRQPDTASHQDSEPLHLRGALETLPDEWSLLTFHLTDDRTLAWIGNNETLRLHELSRGDELRSLLQTARQEIRTVNSDRTDWLLAELGERLIAPLSPYLQPNILFFGAGALSDFPLEALVVDGEFLIERHLVQNALSLTGLGRSSAELDSPLRPRSIFLAGDPLLGGADAQALAGSARELQLVEASFPGAENRAFAGRLLDRSALEDSAFSTSDLVHIASHASIDMTYPELSRIELSNGYLTPQDLSGRHLSAKLVVLSACGTAGLSRFEYDSQLGFVSEFLNAGAANVMATLWPIPDKETGNIIDWLYQNLADERNVGESLRFAKLAMIDSETSSVDRWVAFQLYIE